MKNKNEYRIVLSKKLLVRVINVLLKYLLPAILGWLEGDSHVFSDFLL